jgi:sugar phosphate isomerase/epimerase
MMPGYGHIDFQLIIKTLHDIGYNQYISFEPVLTYEGYESATKSGLELIKTIASSAVI